LTGEIYCIDNDIILKLATISLFDETLKIFNVDYSQVKILYEAIYQFRKLEEIKKKQSNSNKRKDIRNQIKQINSNPSKAIKIAENLRDNVLSENDVNIDIVNKLGVDGIDEGEARLIAYLSEKNILENNTYLLTGDKRCLKVLSNLELTEIVEPIKGKIWCFEQLILRNINKYGFDFIQNKVYPFRDCDKNLKFIFGYSQKAPKDIVEEDLYTEITRLKEETGDILYPYPD
jgi:hypothetical protein